MRGIGRKKARGQRRKLRALEREIEALQPFQETSGSYEHFHVPCRRDFLEGTAIRGWVRTAFCRAWLEAAARFLKQKPDVLPFCKVVAVLSFPHLWDSQLIVFYDSAYYETFWERKGPWQSWEPVPEETVSEIRRRGVETSLAEKGYREILRNEDGTEYREILWFYGEI